MKPTLLATLAALGCAAVGCGKAEDTARSIAPRSTDLGTGLNAVERTYPRAAGELIDIARNTLASFDLKLKSDLHDALGGELAAIRADGHTVTAKVTAVDAGRARVSVWVAPGDRALAELIQQRIAEKAGVDSKGP